MAVEPIVEGRSTPLDDPLDELINAVGTDRTEEDFWTEADRSRAGARSKGRARRHRARERQAHPVPSRAVAERPGTRSLRQRAAAAWAAELTAMRALRTRPVGSGAAAPNRRRRKIVAAALGVVALLALAATVGDAVLRDGPTSEQAGAAGATDGSGDGLSSSGIGTDGDRGRSTVPSKLIDAPSARTPVAKPKTSKPSTTPATPTTVPVVNRPAAGSPATPSANPPAAPAPAAANPRPVTSTPPAATPTTTAPRPAVAPRIQAFTATTASQPGGACSAVQWATTFAWSTSAATSVAITGLLEPTLSSLPADGSKVVCRALPAAPLGGWTLTATGAGGTATAKA